MNYVFEGLFWYGGSNYELWLSLDKVLQIWLTFDFVNRFCFVWLGLDLELMLLLLGLGLELGLGLGLGVGLG